MAQTLTFVRVSIFFEGTGEMRKFWLVSLTLVILGQTADLLAQRPGAGFKKELLERSVPSAAALAPVPAAVPATVPAGGGVIAVPPANKVHALLIGHSSDKQVDARGNKTGIGWGVDVSGFAIETLLTTAFSTSELSLSCVGFSRNGNGPLAADGGRLNQATIDAAIDQMNASVGPNDAVICFVMVHGAYDVNQATADKEYGHFFGMESGFPSYYRADIHKKLKQKSPKLCVLLSDSCNVPNGLTRFSPAPALASPADVQVLQSLRTLLLNHTGDVSINASSWGQFSFYDPNQGGYCMQAFEDVIRSARADVNWQECFTLLTTEEANRFHDGFPRGCPYAWDPVGQRVLTLSPLDPRTQKTLQPMAMVPLTNVIQDGVHVLNGPSQKMCPCPPEAEAPAEVPPCKDKKPEA